MSSLHYRRSNLARLLLTFALGAAWLAPASQAAAADAIDVDLLPAPKPPDPGRHGFYMRFQPKVDAVYLWSKGNVLSDFRQGIPSSARATGWGFDFQIGGRIVERVALAFSYQSGSYQHAVVGIRDQSVRVKNLQLETLSFGALVTVTPFEDLGWFGSFGLGIAGVEVSDSASGYQELNGMGGPQRRGASTSATAGYEFRISQGWWVGGGVHLSYYWILDPSPVASHALEPALVVTATYY